MKNDRTIKIIGTVVTLVGFGITIIQKQLDDKSLEEKVQREVQKQLKKL